MVGKVGRHLKGITKGKMSIRKIIALDPAGECLSFRMFRQQIEFESQVLASRINTSMDSSQSPELTAILFKSSTQMPAVLECSNVVDRLTSIRTVD
jgi:hypothetical protein